MRRCAEGLELLEDERFVLERPENPACVLCARARAYGQLGRVEGTEKFREKAAILEAGCLLLRDSVDTHPERIVKVL